MNDLAEKIGMSLNYKINGEMCSFKSGSELAEHLRFAITELKEPLLKVESLNPEIGSYDHMDEILELSYQAASYIKGIQAMASCIQESGNFNEYKHYDICSLAMRCSEALYELSDIADAAGHVYESDCQAQKMRNKLAAVPA